MFEQILEQYGLSTNIEYIETAIVFVGLIIILKIFKTVLLKYLKIIAQKTVNKIDDHIVYAIDKLGFWFYVGVSLYITTHYFLELEKDLLWTIDRIILIIFTYYGIRIAQVFIDFLSEELIEKNKKEGQPDGEEIIHIGGQILKYGLWVIAALFVLSNLGIDVIPLIAGASIGGIAIAFALQNILTDVFASFSIYFDKPFRVGDFIVVGQDSGIVKKIGIKSTRLTSLQGEEIIISNKTLTETKINNYKRMEKRRVIFQIGITYNTPLEKVKKVTSIIKKIIEEDKDLELDRTNFLRFGDYALIFETAYFVKSNSYAVYAAKQERINLRIMEEFKKEKISFAYPTQTVYYQKIS
ncbi:MAG: mechanosensitive ion channel family protein [Candidatus Micrarchaeota archaeon]|nr:mechanosensitive ion channel family protein [Candidatus Micrarchaeota archaeon]